MKTALMIFSTKPKKIGSIKPSDKRRLCIVNNDFKLYEGLLSRRFRKISGRVLSQHQYVVGDDRNIQHGICKASDSIHDAISTGRKCGIRD